MRLALLFCMIFSGGVHSMNAQTPAFADTVYDYFNDLKVVTGKHQDTWRLDLYAPVLLVDPKTRQVYSNFQDSGKVLQPTRNIFSGVLPREVNISNTATQWNGRHWAMIMLPLPKDRFARLNLMTHELFHRAQKDLGFYAFSPDNPHLDKKQGRIFMRLELEALKKALFTDGKKRKDHIADALLFRQYRQSLFPGADSTENLLELNEGICEYTGLMMSQRNERQVRENFVTRIDQFVRSKSYVRAFAYEAIPIYGWLLREKDKNWNKALSAKTDLLLFFKKSFSIKEEINLEQYAHKKMLSYNGAVIEREETEREKLINEQLAHYRSIFFEKPHLVIPLQNMNMSFDYLSMVPLDDKGTVYPTIRITDNWGILDVSEGALVAADWRNVILSEPDSITATKVSGKGWKLDLKPGFVVAQEGNGLNFILRKK